MSVTVMSDFNECHFPLIDLFFRENRSTEVQASKELEFPNVMNHVY